MRSGIQTIYHWWEEKNVPRFLLILLLAVLALSLPSLLEPYWHGDEGIYLTIGQALRRGKQLYAEVYDNKTPVLYWLTAVAGRQFWLRFFGLISRLVTVVLFYYLSRRFIALRWARRTTTVLLALLFSLPLFEANTANAEIFFIPLTLAGFLLFWRRRFFVAGLLLGGSFLFKSPPLFEFFILVWFAWYWRSNNGQVGQAIKNRLLPLLVGFALPVLLTVVYSGLVGNLETYWQAAFWDNFSYLSSWGGSSPGGLFSSELVRRSLVIGIAAVVLLWQGRQLARETVFAGLWSLAALFAVLLSSRPYPHYWLQLWPPLLLLAGRLVSLWRQKKTKIAAVFFTLPIALAVVAFFYYQFYLYPVIPYYGNFFGLLSGAKTASQYRQWFDPRMDRVYRAAEFLQDSTYHDDPVFIWGNEAMIYALSRRQPPTRFVVAYHLVSHFKGDDRYRSALRRLQNNPPKVVLYDRNFSPHWSGLQEWLHEAYFPLKNIGSLQVWYRFR